VLDESLEMMRRELFTAIVGDVMDGNGLTRQFPPQTRPLRDDTVVVGQEMTLLEADCTGIEIAALQMRKPFGLMLEALDSLKSGDVYMHWFFPYLRIMG